MQRGYTRVVADEFQNPSRAEIRNLLRFSRAIAVVGLSDDPLRPSHSVARSLKLSGFEIFPVNPNLDGPVLGERPYSSVAEIPVPVDIVDVFRASDKVMPAARDAVASGAKALWMQLGVVNEEAAAYTRSHGLIVVQNRCIKVDYDSLVND